MSTSVNDFNKSVLYGLTDINNPASLVPVKVNAAGELMAAAGGGLPAGAAKETKQDAGNASLASIDSHTPNPAKAVVTATIASSGTASGAVDLGTSAICGLTVPATITGTTLSIQGCDTSGGTYGTLYDATNNPATITLTASRRYYIDPLITAGWQFIKILSNAAEGGSRDILLQTRPV